MTVVYECVVRRCQTVLTHEHGRPLLTVCPVCDDVGMIVVEIASNACVVTTTSGQ